VGILGRYVIIISHGLCSSGMFFIVNLYYDRSGRRLLFLNKGMVRNLPAVIIWWFLFCIINFSFPLSLNFIGETLMLIRIVNWDLGIIVYLMYLFVIFVFLVGLIHYIYFHIFIMGRIFIMKIKFIIQV